MSTAETIKILQSCSSGVLAVAGGNGYPYAVPLSYAFQDGKLYFHGATGGHKLDAIRQNDKVSFCVIQADQVVPEAFTTHYRSAIAFGRARILSERGEKQQALECILEKYSPEYLAEGRAEIEREWDRLCVVEVLIEHMTGKASRELMEQIP